MLPPPHTSSISAASTQKHTRMPQPPASQRTKKVSAAPEKPTAPPTMPVASPFLSANHFWAQLITAGYKKAHPSPTGRLKHR